MELEASKQLPVSSVFYYSIYEPPRLNTGGSGGLETCTYHRNNKAVFEPRVSPAFAVTYFCNHCNIRFENTSKYVDTLTLFFQKLEPKVIDP